jgi:hypothetical protein
MIMQACVLIAITGANIANAENLSLTLESSAIGSRGLVYNGKSVFLVGSGSFWLLNDPYYYNSDGSTNLENLRDHLDKYKPEESNGKALGVIRLSAFGTPVRYSGVDHSKKRYPCSRSVTPGARDGGNKFDCSTLDPDFFRHVLTVAREARSRGIILGIILWDEIPLETAPERWGHNPFCPENSIINYGLPSCERHAVPEFYDLGNKLLVDHQQQIIAMFVDTLKLEPNVFFFVGNEYTGPSDWRDMQISIIDDANLVNNSDLLHVTMDYLGKLNSISDGVSADTNRDGLGDSAFRPDGRPAVNQRDYRGAGFADVRRNNWSRFMDGAASAGTRDDYSGADQPYTTFSDAAAADQQLREFVNSISIDLDQLKISDGRFSSGWSARGAEGEEYVAFSDLSLGQVTVDLSDQDGSWELIEWDTTSNSRPLSRGIIDGNKSVTWNLGFAESAIRIVRRESLSIKPNPPSNLTVD